MKEEFMLKYYCYNRPVYYMHELCSKVFNNIYWDSIPLNNEETETKPFFIVGSGRSGNTLLRRILNSKEGIVIPPETYVLGQVIRLHNIHKNLKWEEYVNLILSKFEYHPEFYTFEINSLSKLALKIKDVEPAKRSLSYIVDQFYRFYAQEKGKKVVKWGDKTPLNTRYVFRIKKLFPGAKFIHIIRDGVDVVNSYVSAGLYTDYNLVALRWKKSVQFLQKFGCQHPSSYYEIRYEDLVSDPNNAVKGICDFLGIEFHASMLPSEKEKLDLGDVKYLDHHKNVYGAINTKSIGKGRKNLSPQVIDSIKGDINPLLLKLGYQNL